MNNVCKHILFFSVSETELCLNSLHLDISFITFPTFGPISLWAGLSSSDRKNTILSGNCKGTGGESGLLGDLQAHRPRPLTAHTHPPNLHPTQTTTRSMGTPNSHMHTHNPLPHTPDSISALWQLCCTFPLPPSILLFCG